MYFTNKNIKVCSLCTLLLTNNIFMKVYDPFKLRNRFFFVYASSEAENMLAIYNSHLSILIESEIIDEV